MRRQLASRVRQPCPEHACRGTSTRLLQELCSFFTTASACKLRTGPLGCERFGLLLASVIFSDWLAERLAMTTPQQERVPKFMAATIRDACGVAGSERILIGSRRCEDSPMVLFGDGCAGALDRCCGEAMRIEGFSELKFV